MQCEVCRGEECVLVHKGTRDNPNIDVYKCKKCGIKFLNQKIDATDEFYENGGMHGTDNVAIAFAEWNDKDNVRKAETVKEYIQGKRVLDFGCGYGGAIVHMQKYAEEISGVELGKDELGFLREKGIDAENNIENYSKKFDVITLFHVFEHLKKPRFFLNQFKDYLTGSGRVYIEVPHAEDALLELYECSDFADYTYWSPHLYLYNETGMRILAEECGYIIEQTLYIQRYPLANHLFWLSGKGPGGQIKWDFLCDDKLDAAYADKLKEIKKTDTLAVLLRRKEIRCRK